MSTERSRVTRYTLEDFSLDWPVVDETARPSTLDLFSAIRVVVPGVYRFNWKLRPAPRSSSTAFALLDLTKRCPSRWRGQPALACGDCR